MKNLTALTALVTLSVLAACASERSATPVAPTTAEPADAPGALTPDVSAKSKTTFNTYWYQGLAELNRFELEQSRYGEIHKGEAVHIYVTEDFLTDKQVKYEFGDKTNAVPILKLNAYRRFYTGIYPYNLLTSVFTPLGNGPQKPLKATFSAQEWCGHAYSQLNLRDGKYQGEGHSYFQAEADDKFELAAALLEDDVFLRIRRDPTSLPTGEIQVIPGLHYLRLLHKKAGDAPATATLTDAPNNDYGENVRMYEIKYTGKGRTVRYFFEKAFPYQIRGWEEEAAGLGGRTLTTKAKRTNAMLLDYWGKHTNSDAPLRKELGLEW